MGFFSKLFKKQVVDTVVKGRVYAKRKTKLVF